MTCICDDCYSRIEKYGHPCTSIMIIVVNNYFYGQPTILSKDELDEFDEFKQPLQYLEQKGLVLSSEISQDAIAIVPNVGYALIRKDEPQICWCRMIPNKINW